MVEVGHLKKLYVYKSELGTFTFQWVSPSKLSPSWEVFVLEDEYLRLEKILKDELSENDELGSEFVLVGILKEQIRQLKDEIIRLGELKGC